MKRGRRKEDKLNKGRKRKDPGKIAVKRYNKHKRGVNDGKKTVG
jgi:hypothetical protein